MNKKVVEWSNIPEELLVLVANKLFSDVELLRVRSICKSWRSTVATNEHLPNHLNHRRTNVLFTSDGRLCLLSPAPIYRVVSSSCPKQGWLLKIQDVSEFSQRLFCPLSRKLIKSPGQTLNLLVSGVTEIYQTYDVEELREDSTTVPSDLIRVVRLDNLVFMVDSMKQIWCCKSDENSGWTRVLDEEVKHFSDIIVHNRQVFALDLKGAIWWISLSELNIFQYGPSTTLEYYEVDDFKEKRLVVYRGDLCIVHRFCREFRRCLFKKTVGFKVYKMNEEVAEWVEVKSLGDKAIVMATDSCFTIEANEYYGCLENSVYFTDEREEDNIKVFKLGDGSVTTMAESSGESCFQMFSPPWV